MSVALHDALQDVDLQVGQTYSFEVKGRWVELRVLAEGPPLQTAEGPMLAPWVEFRRQLRSSACGPGPVPSPCPIHPTFPRMILTALCQHGRRRARIQPLYREHLAKHFADTYSRIGLPQPYATE